MIVPRVVRLEDVAPQRWRNGGGFTRELLAWPAPSDWRVRISVADVASDGPFSVFPGVERWFVVLEGAGVDLSVGERAHRVRLGDAALRFDGGVATACQLLDGPTRDLNLMLQRARGGLFAADDGRAWSPDARSCGLFAAVGGSCRADGETFAMAAGSLVWFERAPARLEFRADAQRAGPPGWWCAVTPAESA
jgi:hypothetical protein